jgi:N-acetyl-anhydromuramyl-L-alanine amidase AmpD
MANWHPTAVRVPIAGTPGLSPAAGRPKIVLHTTEGSTIEGAESAYRASGGSTPHFTISPRGLHQHIAVNLCAYSLKHPAGTAQTNRAGLVIQIEQVGFASETDDWSDAYYDRVGALCRWIARQTDVPLKQVSGSIHADYSNPRRIPEDEFAEWSGVCGHVHVPNNDHTDPGRGYHIGKVLN